jgi:exonuclease SbcD
VWLREPARAGLREDTISVMPNALEVRIDPEFAAPLGVPAHGRDVSGAKIPTPDELFADYCDAEQVRDQRVTALFTQLHDEVTAAVGRA